MTITIDEVKANLKANGIDTTSLTDDTIQQMIDYATKRIISLTGIDHNPVTRNDVDLYPSPTLKNYLLPYYPVTSIESIRINNEKELTTDDYYLDQENGIIKFKTPEIIFPEDFEILSITYTTKVTETYWENNVEPVILDLITYQNNPIYTNGGIASSISEGDVSVSYDNTSSVYTIFYKNLMNNIENLKTINKPRATML